MSTSRRFVIGAGAAFGLCVALAAPAFAETNADKLLNDDKYDQAKTAYTTAIKSAPKQAAPRIGLIRTLLRMDDWSAAVKEGRAFVGVAPQSADAHAMLSLAYMRGGQPEAALKEAAEAQKLNATGYWPLIAHGRALAWNYKKAEARAAFKKATEAQPETEEGYVYWLNVFGQNDRFQFYSEFNTILTTLRKMVEKRHPRPAPKNAEETEKRKQEEAKRKSDEVKRAAYYDMFTKTPPVNPTKGFTAAQMQDADEGKTPPISFSFPFERAEREGGKNDIIIPMSINGMRVRMFYDTGAGEGITIFRGASQRLNLPTLTTALAGGVNGVEVTKLIKADTMRIGSQTWSNIPIDALNHVVGEFDGLLGGAVFDKYCVTIDFKENQMTLTRGKEAVAPLPQKGNHTIDVPFHLENGYIFVRVRVGDRDEPIWTILDTGAEGNGVLTLSLAREIAQKIDRTSSIEANVRGLFGGVGDPNAAVKVRLFAFPIDIGCLVGERTPYFVQFPDLMGTDKLDDISRSYQFNLAGLLGNDYLGLRCERVTIDYPHRVLTMEMPE